MADYVLTPEGLLQRTSDGATIPLDPSNSDYQAFSAWIAAGNTLDPRVNPADDTTFGDDPWSF